MIRRSLYRSFFFALTFVALTLIPACTGDAEKAPRKPEAAHTDLTDEELDALGKNVEIALASGDYAMFDSLFSFAELFERIVYPEVPSEQASREFIQGFIEAENKSGQTFGEQIMTGLGGTSRIRYLGVRRDDEGTSLLFRVIVSEGGFTYLRFLVGLDETGRTVFVDMHSTGTGDYVSQTIRGSLANDDNNPLSRLLDGNARANETSAAIGKMSSLLTSGSYTEVLEYFDTLPEELRKERAVRGLAVTAAAKTTDQVRYLQLMEETKALFPNDPTVDLALIDLYFLRGEFDALRSTIDRLDRTVRDPYLDFYRGMAALGKEEFDSAIVYGERLFAYDSTMTESYDLLLSANLQKKDFAAVATALGRMDRASGGTIDPAAVEGAEMYKEFVQSPEYAQWKAKR